jgi:hypothetical protein
MRYRKRFEERAAASPHDSIWGKAAQSGISTCPTLTKNGNMELFAANFQLNAVWVNVG